MNGRRTIRQSLSVIPNHIENIVCNYYKLQNDSSKVLCCANSSTDRQVEGRALLSSAAAYFEGSPTFRYNMYPSWPESKLHDKAVEGRGTLGKKSVDNSAWFSPEQAPNYCEGGNARATIVCEESQR
jgi:hypothetical protein